MKVNIGPFVGEWWGPYQIAALLRFVGVKEDTYRKIGEWLSDTKFRDFCEWINDKRKRKISIHIDNYDVWNMDETLAMIILPMLKMLKAQKHGFCGTDKEDVPEEFRNLTPYDENAQTDAYCSHRWEWIMNELIWTFEQLHPDNDWEAQYTNREIDIEFGEVDPATGLGELKLIEKPGYKFDFEGMQKHQERIKNGLRLFGKYYQGLWD